MTRRIGRFGTLATAGLLLSIFCLAQDAKPAAKPDGGAKAEPKTGDAKSANPAAAAAFEKFKALAGDWVSVDDPKTIAASYRVTAGGSAVIETLFPGGEHEMVTVYTRDGDSLLLTHYCMLGNQPRMRCKPTADAKSFKFDFDGGTNLKPADAHMHECTITPTTDSIKSEWAMFENGKRSDEHVGKFDLVRKK